VNDIEYNCLSPGKTVSLGVDKAALELMSWGAGVGLGNHENECENDGRQRGF